MTRAEGPVYETTLELRLELKRIFTEEAVGEEQAIHAQDLEDKLGTSRRQIRKAIAELVRIDGEPIVSESRRGYYRGATGEQLMKGAAELRRRALSLLYRRGRMLDMGQHELGGQQALDLAREARSNDIATQILDGERR